MSRALYNLSIINITLWITFRGFITVALIFIFSSEVLEENILLKVNKNKVKINDINTPYMKTTGISQLLIIIDIER